MKRLIAILLLLCLILGLFACAQNEEFLSPISFYYLRAPLPNGELSHGSADSVIAPEIREGEGHLDNYNYLIEMYLWGPLDSQFRTPFPVGTSLKEFSLDDGIASITLSGDFGKLTGIDLTLACGCLTMTVLELTGAKSITIRTETALLDGKESITMDRGNIILIDDTTPETN